MDISRVWQDAVSMIRTAFLGASGSMRSSAGVQKIQDEHFGGFAVEVAQLFDGVSFLLGTSVKSIVIAVKAMRTPMVSMQLRIRAQIGSKNTEQ